MTETNRMISQMMPMTNVGAIANRNCGNKKMPTAMSPISMRMSKMDMALMPLVRRKQKQHLSTRQHISISLTISN